jgi:hypothetical protein
MLGLNRPKVAVVYWIRGKENNRRGGENVIVAGKTRVRGGRSAVFVIRDRASASGDSPFKTFQTFNRFAPFKSLKTNTTRRGNFHVSRILETWK